jgi:hypothetical protein
MGASPTDRANLAPVDLGAKRVQITRGLHRLFASQDHEAARGAGVGDLSPLLGVGYFDAQGQAQRGAAAGGEYGQGKRGQMDDLPTPQALIRMITGVGDPAQGR